MAGAEEHRLLRHQQAGHLGVRRADIGGGHAERGGHARQRVPGPGLVSGGGQGARRRDHDLGVGDQRGGPGGVDRGGHFAERQVQPSGDRGQRVPGCYLAGPGERRAGHQQPGHLAVRGGELIAAQAGRGRDAGQRVAGLDGPQRAHGEERAGRHGQRRVAGGQRRRVGRDRPGGALDDPGQRVVADHDAAVLHRQHVGSVPEPWASRLAAAKLCAADRLAWASSAGLTW